MNRRIFAVALLSALSLSACQQPSPGDDAAGETPSQAVGNAVPAESPPESDVRGEVLEIGEVSDLVLAGDELAVRVGDELRMGTLEQFRGGDVEVTPARGCTDVTATRQTVVLTCGKEVRVLGGEILSLPDPARTAVATTTGEIIVAPEGSEKIDVYRAGELAEEFSVAGATDELLSLPREGRDDAVVRLNRSETRIQEVLWRDGVEGATLRAGLGAGSMGGSEEGIAIVSDTVGSQILVYMVDDVIRLHQTAPVPLSPWAAAWDGELAWVASTATNTATSFDISRGVPVKESEVSTIGDVRHMVSAPGAVVLGGSRGLQIIPTES